MIIFIIIWNIILDEVGECMTYLIVYNIVMKIALYTAGVSSNYITVNAGSHWVPCMHGHVHMQPNDVISNVLFMYIQGIIWKH